MNWVGDAVQSKLGLMNGCLANAAPAADSNAIIMFVFVCLLLMGGVLLLALWPVMLANRRGGRRSQNVRSAAVVWSLLTWGTAVYALWQHDQWSQTYNQRIMSGYYDAADPYTTQDAPPQPWILWGISGGGYAALLAWSASGKIP
ncbi:MAG TPA: hypothetical protein VHY37_00410 [Tepidisphaeraceae bacterium]|jgi:hypothetical protein|nr:hypothetical protein [Tepidisphaeraceae bacterium]